MGRTGHCTTFVAGFSAGCCPSARPLPCKSMKLALLGADVESLRLAEAAVAAGHEISWQADTGAGEPAGPWSGPHAPAGLWEDLLDAQTADAIIIGHGSGGDEFRAHQLQEFARLD